jgi:hypothetical protein
MGQTQEMKMPAIHSFNAEKITRDDFCNLLFNDLRDTFLSKEVNSYTNTFNIFYLNQLKDLI